MWHCSEVGMSQISKSYSFRCGTVVAHRNIKSSCWWGWRMTMKMMMNSVRLLWTQCGRDARSSSLPKRAEHPRLCCELLPWKSATAPGPSDRVICECRWRNGNDRRRQRDTSREAEHLSDTSRGPAAQGGRDLPAQDCQGQSALMQTIYCQGEGEGLVNLILVVMVFVNYYNYNYNYNYYNNNY